MSLPHVGEPPGSLVWSLAMSMVIFIFVLYVALSWSVRPAHSWATAKGVHNPDVRCFGYRCTVRTGTTTYHLVCDSACVREIVTYVP